MPIIKSAKKALRGSKRKKVMNDRRKRIMKTSEKDLRTLITEKKKKEAMALLPTVQKALDKAAKRGIIKKNTAARKKSRLSTAVARIA